MAFIFTPRICSVWIILCCIFIICLLCDNYSDYATNPPLSETGFARVSGPQHKLNDLQAGTANKGKQSGQYIEPKPSNGEWIQNKLNVEFLHPFIALETTTKLRNPGLFAIEDISFGTVLSVEYPILDISSGSAKFGGNGGKPWTAYSIISRVGFNLPQNGMVVIGGKEKEHKALLITTRAIVKGEEIVLDHFMDWSDSELLEPDSLRERFLQCQDRGFHLNGNWIAFIKQLQNRSLFTVQRHKLLLELYPNGLIGLDSENEHLRVIEGCIGIVRDIKDCTKKVQFTEDINSGNIFDRETYEPHNSGDVMINKYE